MAIKLMYIPNNNPKNTQSVGQNQGLKRLNKQLNVTNQSKIRKRPQQISQRYHKTLGTSVMNSPMSPPSLTLTEYSNKNNLIHK